MPVFGAGTGVPLGMPNWNQLVTRILEHPDVNGACLNGSSGSQSSKTQMLFQHFRKLRNDARKAAFIDFDPENETYAEDRKTARAWREIVKDCLYKNVLEYETHPYLKEFLPVIRKAPLTVNYNFDDALEHLMAATSKGAGADSKGYEVIWEPMTQFRSEGSVIYHPNGFLPKDARRGGSQSLVFSEDTFADQLIDAQRGHYSTLLSHFFRYTGLLIGLSLEDATLKHLLRQSALGNPGHVHYYVAFRTSSPTEVTDEMAAVIRSNFETYNLVTIFLSGEEYSLLANLLTADENEFAHAVAKANIPKSFTYYLSGAVGVGKSSVLAHLKSLNAIEEWLEERPELLSKAATELTDDEQRVVDEWINGQFTRRNELVRRGDFRINVVDRSPLDPVAFAKGASARAKELKAVYSGLDIAEGEVLFMSGRPETMHARTADRHKDGSAEYIDGLQKRFLKLWDGGRGRKIDTAHLSLPEVVKKISRVIHLDDYGVSKLSVILDSISEESA